MKVIQPLGEGYSPFSQNFAKCTKFNFWVLTAISKRKVPETWASYFYTDLVAGKFFLYECVYACVYVCMYVCGYVCVLCQNLYSIDTKFCTQVGLENSKVQFEDGLSVAYCSLCRNLKYSLKVKYIILNYSNVAWFLIFETLRSGRAKTLTYFCK